MLAATHLTGPDPAAAAVDVPDLFGIGLLLSIVGCFLLANSIVFRHPRELVAQFFGVESKRLTSIRSYIFHRVQIQVGFLFLLAGFGLQLFGRFRVPAGEGVAASGLSMQWVGLVVLAVVALELGGWWFSHLLFRRYVREHFLLHPPNLEADLALARELAELFGIPAQGDDSVQSFLLRVRHRIGLLGSVSPQGRPGPAGARPTPREEVELDEAEAEEEFGLTP